MLAEVRNQVRRAISRIPFKQKTSYRIFIRLTLPNQELDSLSTELNLVFDASVLPKLLQRSTTNLHQQLFFTNERRRAAGQQLPIRNQYKPTYPIYLPPRISISSDSENLVISINNRSDYSSNYVPSSNHINDLSDAILLKIFSNLKFEDLFENELVCRRWRDLIIRGFWQSLSEITIDEKFIDKWFSQKPYFYKRKKNEHPKSLIYQTFKRILRRTSKTNLTYLDISYVAELFDDFYEPYCLDVIADRCQCLTFLSLNNFKIFANSTIQFTNLIATVCSKLETLYLRKSLIRDIHLKHIFSRCHALTHLDLGNCSKLIGESLNELPTSIVYLNLESCVALSELYVTEMLKRHPQIKFLYLNEVCEDYNYTAKETFLSLIGQHMTSLITLSLTINKNDTRRLMSISTLLPHLTFLNLTRSYCHDAALAQVLHSCVNLSTLILANCGGVTDNVFCSKQIHAPLSNLVLNYCIELTNNTLNSIWTQLYHTIFKLDIEGCQYMTCSGVCNLLSALPHLNHLNVNRMQCVDNRLLEKALNDRMEQHIYVNCAMTGIDYIAFRTKFPFNFKCDYRDDEHLVEFDYKQLIFLTDIKEILIKERSLSSYDFPQCSSINI
jgi:hypothetical protein